MNKEYKKILREIEKLLDKYIKPEKREIEERELRKELVWLIYDYAPFLVESRLQELSKEIIKLIKKPLKQ